MAWDLGSTSVLGGTPKPLHTCKYEILSAVQVAETFRRVQSYAAKPICWSRLQARIHNTKNFTNSDISANRTKGVVLSIGFA
jgi:hypothetical protein